MGFSSLVLSFTAYLLVLSWADYSFVQPASSISYGMVMLLGHVLLGEVLTLTRVVGVLIISLQAFLSAIPRRAPRRVTEWNIRFCCSS